MKTKISILVIVMFGFICGQCQVDTSQASFYSVYTKVLSVYCAIPACHDGSFEPDLRTLESAYYTLVYHPIVKNNRNKTFTYRVMPKNSATSVLYERVSNCCFVNTNDRMPFTIGDTLSGEQINLIKKWIENGAKDICGNEPKMIIAPINIESDYNSYFNDTVISNEDNRLDKVGESPFIIHGRYDMVKIKFSLSTSDLQRIAQLSNPILKITDSLDNFFQTKIVSLNIHRNNLEVNLRSSDFKRGKIYYMQVEFTDQKAKRTMHYPQKSTEYLKKRNWSFILKD